ncbi:cytochrome c biogenesis protein CcsA [Gorillibacterium massiliense]|uniref:cytochrome c biogenesis protein CcsA n=1 Tax=Gorillibacterium massiliense TaxID=1280390 RepID=UPI0004B14E5B|nr:cytochrome c biogenesis protein CcsA [Gorillibacterium massiliense]
MSSFLDTVSEWSSSYLLIAFILYCLSFFLFVLSIIGSKWSGNNEAQHKRNYGKWGFLTAIIGFVGHLLFFFTRWYASGHIPTSNMYEFMTFLGMMIIAAFIVIYAIYKTPLVGMFVLPIAVLIISYAAVFPSEVQPLVPSLKSNWLKIHVTTAAAGEAFFAIGFAGGLMHLLRTVDFRSKGKAARREQRGVEFTLFVILILAAFILSIFSFNAGGYQAQFAPPAASDTAATKEQAVKIETYVLPPLVKPYGAETLSMTPFLGMKKPLLEAPYWMKGVSAGRKLNTVIWSLIGGAILYGVLRLLIRKPIGAAISPALQSLEAEDIDEISYRAIAIGYPVFTLGALLFAMIWADQAWGQFWGWDPKEVWALITWLFYAAYLHLRLSRGWVGKRSSWMSVIGFLIVMFTLVGVNLIIAGMHSYAGVD